MMPMIGARKINRMVLMIVSASTILDHEKLIPFTESACAIAAPANPPIKVCDDEDGMPYHQVNKFQKIAAINPEKITGNVINSL